MGLIRTALIFGAGYVLGRPEGRAKVAELANRPEVAQLRQQAASTVAGGVKSGKEQLTKAAGAAAGNVSKQVSPEGDAGPSTNRRGRRLPSFPKRGARHAASTATATAPTSAAREPAATEKALTHTGPTASGEPDAAPALPTAPRPTDGPTT